MSTPGPLRAVLGVLDEGASSLDDIANRTGLSRDLVTVAIDRLVAMGRLDAQELGGGCPSGGCGTCSAATSSGGCGTGPRRGPILLTLRARR